MITKPLIYNVAMLVLLSTPMVQAGECLEVEGPTVRVSVITPFVEYPHSLSQDRILTSTPDPGTRRWITAEEIRQWGLSPIEGAATSVLCVERQLHPLLTEDVVKEVQSALERNHEKVLSVGSTSIQPLLVPKGRLILPPAGFQSISSNNGVCSFLWRAAVEYDSHRLIGVKILGHFQAETTHFVATRNLQPGDVLSGGDYERIAKPGCSRHRLELAPPEGSIIRRALSKGDDIEMAMLNPAPVVDEGGAVWVRASAGGASVSIEAIAEKSGRRGESVFVRNKESGKRIRVLLTGKGEASAFVSGAAK
jgi:flagella basal body P-ring formation protein FlgA